MYSIKDVKTGQIIFKETLQCTRVDDEISADLVWEQETTNDYKYKERLDEMLKMRYQVITKAWKERK